MPNTSMKEQQLYRHRRILQIECELLRRKSVEKIYQNYHTSITSKKHHQKAYHKNN